MTAPLAPLSVSDKYSARGLTASEVAQRVALGLVNRAPRSDWADYRDIVARNTLTLFNALVVPAAIALFFFENYRGAFAVSGMAVINTIIGLAQEVRAKRHLDRLAILSETRARVLRDGEPHTVPASAVVLDDHLLLSAGEPVVADGTVLAARFLEVDEALLTGESDPVPRREGDRLLSGSFCVAGEGAYRATRVGREAFAQKTSAEARRYHRVSSPLQRVIDRLITLLTGLALALCAFYVILHGLGRLETEEFVSNVAATITSMVPQGLVLMATLAFTLGAVRMSLRGAVVQRLNAVESMASIDVLCMDKTGTLTTSRLSLDRLHVLEGSVEEASRRLRLFAWASLDEGSKSIQALRAALGPVPPYLTLDLLDQVPFKSQNRYSAVRVRVGPEEHALVMGAFEALRPYLDSEAALKAEAAWWQLLPTGLRLLLFTQTEPAPFNGSLQGLRLRPLAIVALTDELRPEAGAVLTALAGQGIRFKILSGDNAETVRATVSHLKLPLAREPVVSGEELAHLPDAEKVIQERSVFGRVAPHQKLQIVEALQARGSRVGMIGDGINDILPIKRSDLGIAMGEGSAATKTVAGLVLENNNFELLPATLDEGRTIVRNVRRAAKLFLLKNVYTLVLIVGAMGFMRMPFPYEPQQVTLLNLLTIGVPAFLIMLGRPASGAPVRRGFVGEVAWFAGATGLIMGTAGLVVYRLGKAWYADDVTQRTLLLSTLVLMGLGTVVRLVAERGNQATKGDGLVLGWVTLALPLYLLIMYLPPIATWEGVPLSAAHFFALTALSAGQWALVLAVAAPALAASVAVAAFRDFHDKVTR